MSDEVKLLPCVTKASLEFADGSTCGIDFATHTSIDEALSKLRLASTGEARAIEATRPTEQDLGETLESISAWCEETFGPASPLRMAARANEEMAELIDVASRSETYSDKVLVEAADVVICLARFPGLWAAVERKMAINRARVWRLTGEGTGYHVPQGDAHA